MPSLPDALRQLAIRFEGQDVDPTRKRLTGGAPSGRPQPAGQVQAIQANGRQARGENVKGCLHDLSRREECPRLG